MTNAHHSAISRQAETLLQGLEAFLVQFNSTFLVIATELPVQVRAVQQLMSPISDIAEGQFPSNMMTQISQMHRQIDGTKSELDVRLERLDNRYNLLKKRFDNIDSQLQVIECRCDDLNLFSLNTRLATKATTGIAASTFRAITSELTERSRIMSAFAHSLGNQLKEVFGEYRQNQEKKNEVGEQFEKLNQQLEDSMRNASHTFGATAAEIQHYLVEAEQLLAKLTPITKNLMVKIQEQDIVRQALEHVAEVLREVHQVSAALQTQTGPHALRDAVFVQQAAALAGSLLNESRQSANEFIAHTLDGLSMLENISQTIGQLQNVAEQKEQYSQNIDHPIALLQSRNQMLNDHLAIIHENVAGWTDISNGLARTATERINLRNSATELNMLEISMRINGSMDTELEKETQNLAKEFREIFCDIKNALAQSGDEIEATRDELQWNADNTLEIDDTILQLTTHIENIRHDALLSLTNLTEEITSAVSQAKTIQSLSTDRTNQLRNLLAMFPEEQAVTAFMADAAEYGSGFPSETNMETLPAHHIAPDERIQSLVSGFAVFSQKMTAQHTISMEIEQGDEEGELTLF
ncbi:MAG: hypothetical protein JXR45_09270 [Deltaproteobacteria bacterium]|nr:hypothetical protein [Deltaproteobacteria bacterium]